MKNRHVFNHSFAFGISRKAIFASVAIFGIPVLADAGPSVGLGYSDIGLTGHAGRPGVTLTADNLYKNDVVASGSATFARGFYGVDASLGKTIQTGGTVSFEPYLSTGFLNLNYTPGQSVQDFYGLAGANMNIPLGKKIALEFGGGYGHTLMTFGGAGGAVYKGKAEIVMEAAKHVTTSINVSYIHIPGAGQQVMTYGAGLSYHFS